jgi:hypothetical protein
MGVKERIDAAKERRIERHTLLLKRFMEKDWLERLKILESLSVWDRTMAVVQERAEAYLDEGRAFDDGMTMALAMIEYTRPGTRPQARMGALRMVEAIQRRQSLLMKTRVLARVRELDGIERGWLTERERSKRTAAVARRKKKDQDSRTAAKVEARSSERQALSDAEIDAQIREHLR